MGKDKNNFVDAYTPYGRDGKGWEGSEQYQQLDRWYHQQVQYDQFGTPLERKGKGKDPSKIYKEIVAHEK